MLRQRDEQRHAGQNAGDDRRDQQFQLRYDCPVPRDRVVNGYFRLGRRREAVRRTESSAMRQAMSMELRSRARSPT